MELIYNEAVDFIFSVKRFANRNKPRENNLPGLPELKKWCDEYEKKLSPFLLSDISLLVDKMIAPSVYIYLLFDETPGINTGAELLDRLSAVTPEKFMDYLRTKLLNIQDDEITVEMLHEVLVNEGLTPGYDPVEESELLHGFIQDPGNFLKRLHSTYSDFYKLAYLPAKAEYKALALEKLEWHSKRLSRDHQEYFEMLGLHSFLKYMGTERQPRLFYSFFSDTDISSFWSTYTLVIGAGTDSRILHRSARDKADTFFASFGDPKRLEILRLTAQRPWFSSELAKHFNLKPATLSYHLNILTDAELLTIEKGDSRRFYYSLNREKVEDYLKYVSRDLLGPEDKTPDINQ